MQNLYAIPAELRGKKSMCGIYVIYNVVTEKAYVGSSKNIRKRLYDHVLYLNSGIHNNKALQRAWDKYTEDCFEFIIVEECDESNLAFIEQLWIDAYNSYLNGYNARPISNNNSGYIWNDQQRLNLSNAKKGFKHSEESKAKMRFKKPEMSERLKGNKINLGRKYIGEDKILNALRPRKFDKWPCPDGSRCKCQDCRKKKYDVKRKSILKKRQLANA